MEQSWEDCPVDIVERMTIRLVETWSTPGGDLVQIWCAQRTAQGRKCPSCKASLELVSNLTYVLHQIAEAVSPSPKTLSAMRLVSTSWREAVRHAKVAITPGGEGCFASEGLGNGAHTGEGDAQGGDGQETCQEGRQEEVFLHRVTSIDLNRRHVSWVMSSKDVRMVAPFFSTSTESLIMDNMQKPDLIGELLAHTHIHLQNLKLLSLQKSSISDADLVLAIESLPRLQTLDVSGCMFLRGDFLGALSALHDLEVLRLGGCGLHVASYNEAWEEVMLKGGMRGRLKELVLHGNVVSDAEVRALFHVKDSLVYLDVRRCSDVTFDGVYFIGREMLGLETLKVGPVFGVDARRGVEEVWEVLRRGKGTRLVNLEVFGMEDGGMEGPGTGDTPGEGRRMAEPGVQGERASEVQSIESRLRMVSFMDTNVCLRRLRGLHHVEYLNISRSLPISINSTGHEYASVALSYAVSGFAFPRLKTFKASHSSMPWHVVRAVMEGAPGIAHLHLGGWQGLKPSRLASPATHQEMMEGFSRALCGLRELETLRLEGMHLKDGHIHALLSGGMLESRLRVLDLSSNANLVLGGLEWDRWPLGALEVLNISHTSIKVGATPELRDSLSLEELFVSGRNVDSDRGSIDRFVDFVRRAPNLTTLHMADITGLSDSALATILLDDRMQSSLEDLNIAGCSSLTHQGLDPLSKLTKLTRLDVSRLRQAVTDDNLAAILRRNTLTELRASGADLTPASLEALLNSKLLHYADISFCFGMGDDEQCSQLVSNSGSPIKIRLPRGSARLGLFSEQGLAREEREEREERGTGGVGIAVDEDATRQGGLEGRLGGGGRAGRRLAFE